MESIVQDNTKRILAGLPADIEVVAAAKSRSVGEIEQAIKAGIKIIGENYVQEARDKFDIIGGRVAWHFIGHLQKNKVKEAVEIFDMIETVDSFKIAREIDKACKLNDRTMPVLIEVNSAREKQKFGLFPEEVEALLKQAGRLSSIRILGLMTMGPDLPNPEEIRPYFKQTRQLFERMKLLNLPGLEMKYLSMGMSGSYQIAIQEGANLVRIGTAIFGKR